MMKARRKFLQALLGLPGVGLVASKVGKAKGTTQKKKKKKKNYAWWTSCSTHYQIPKRIEFDGYQPIKPHVPILTGSKPLTGVIASRVYEFRDKYGEFPQCIWLSAYSWDTLGLTKYFQTTGILPNMHLSESLSIPARLDPWLIGSMCAVGGPSIKYTEWMLWTPPPKFYRFEWPVSRQDKDGAVVRF